MSAQNPTVHRAASDPLDELDGGLAIAPGEVLERVWHLFISMRFGLLLMLVLALLTLVGTMLVQVPAGMKGDPQAYVQWIDGVRPKYGGWTNVLDALGFFDIFNSLVFKAVAIFLVTSTVACSVNRAPLLWKQTTKPRMNVSDAFFAHAPHRAALDVPQDGSEAAAQVVAALRSKGYRTLTQTTGDGAIHVYADRFRWAPFGTVVAHLSLVPIILGAMIGGSMGFKNTDFVLPIGTKTDVGAGTSLSVMATSFTDRYYADTGQPADYASDLVLYDGGRQVAAQTIRVNEPLRYGDVTFYQSFFGPAAEIKVADAGGRVTWDAGVPLRWGTNDELERAGVFPLPDSNLTVVVYGAQSGRQDPDIKAGQVRIEAYQGVADFPSASQKMVDSKVVDQGKPASIAGLTFTFVREQQFTGLIVAKDPGAPFVWFGAALLFLGVCVVFFFHNRRIWAIVHGRAGGSSVSVAAVVRHDVTYRQEFEQLIDGVRASLGAGTVA
ncbi:MAG TPA: cytochrome c biogenesis protein ResB [Candidatus Limnocylindrales bacterium]